MSSMHKGILPIAPSSSHQNTQKQGVIPSKQGVFFNEVEAHPDQNKQDLENNEFELQGIDKVVLSDQSQVVLEQGWSKLDSGRVLSYYGWQRVGHGRALPDCGKTLVFGCLNIEDHDQACLDREVIRKVFVKLKRHSCMRPSCPTCYEKWAGREAHRIEYRLSQWKSSGKVIHVTVSVPTRLWSKDLGELRPDIYRVARAVGFIGGSCIIHAERERCVVCGEHKDTETKTCLKCGGSDFTWVFSPHYHLLGYGWIHGHKVAELHKKEGWIVRNLGIRGSVSGTALYQLSHCSTHETKHGITWFGRLSYNKLKVIPEVIEKEVCPLCQAELTKLVWVGFGEMPFKEEGDYYDEPDNWMRGASFRLRG